MTRPVLLATLLALALGPADALAAQSEPAGITALEISDEIRLDGMLDEPAWARAPHVTSFTQRELDFGAPATERTEVAILFDADALYVGFWGFDSDVAGIRNNEMARDFNASADDNFQLVLDPFDDDRNGYLFVTNPNGARSDALIADNGGAVNQDWNGVWDVRARRTAEGWFAEMRIPFSSLRFRAGSGAAWGINLERNIPRMREQVRWQGWSRDFELQRVSQAGRLEGIRGTGSVRLAEARPYGLGGFEWLPNSPHTNVRETGADLSFLPVPNWKINLTVHPDFAQVESDRAQVNLSRFSLVYPERRAFFLEGSEFFAFNLGGDVQPFYSRRIGLARDRSQVPIWGGARVLGKQAGMTLGAMVLRTGAQDLEPGATFAVARWRQDVLQQSSVGVIAVGRQDSTGTSGTYGLDLRYGTSSLFGKRNMEAGLALARATAPDESAGLAHRLYFNFPNDLVNFSAAWSSAAADFDPQVGYVRRTNYQAISSALNFNPRPSFLPFVRQLQIKPFDGQLYLDDKTGSLQSLRVEAIPLNMRLKSGETFEVNVQRQADHPDEPFELVPGATIPVDTYWWSRVEFQARTFQGRALSGTFEINGGGFYLGQRHEIGFSGRWKTGSHLSLSADYQRNRIDLNGEAFNVREVGGRADFAVSPTLFGALAGQWNNEDKQAILNFRLNWIPEPGSDLFLVINQQVDSRRATFGPQRTTLLSKLIWRVVL